EGVRGGDGEGGDDVGREGERDAVGGDERRLLAATDRAAAVSVGGARLELVGRGVGVTVLGAHRRGHGVGARDRLRRDDRLALTTGERGRRGRRLGGR